MTFDAAISPPEERRPMALPALGGPASQFSARSFLH
jgi:hypothetical protein